MPHIVIQSPHVRTAKLDERGYGCEAYLGVRFLVDDQPMKPVETTEVQLELMYHPQVDYREVVPDATFTIREGGRVVGYGRVTERRLE